MNFLDRNEFNFKPSQKVIDAIKNFDPETLCFYTRIYDEGKKSIDEVGEEAFALLLEVLNGRMTNNEALGYYGSMDIFCLGPVI